MKCPKTMKLALNGVQVAPFGLKLCQNDAPDLRIIFQTLLGPKTSFKNQKNPNNSSRGPAAGGEALRIRRTPQESRA